MLEQLLKYKELWKQIINHDKNIDDFVLPRHRN